MPCKDCTHKVPASHLFLWPPNQCPLSHRQTNGFLLKGHGNHSRSQCLLIKERRHFFAMEVQDSKCLMVTHADGHSVHMYPHIQRTCNHTTEYLCAMLPPSNYISASVYLVKGEMGRAGSVLSAYFSETINSVHKTCWSKTLKGKSNFYFFFFSQ